MFSTKDTADMRRREEKQQALRKKLEKEGHTCIQTLETYPTQTRWCGQEKCVNLK